MIKGLMAVVLALTVLRSQSGAQSSPAASGETVSSGSPSGSAQQNSSNSSSMRNVSEVLSGAANAEQAGFAFQGGLSDVPAGIPDGLRFGQMVSQLSGRPANAVSILPLTQEEKPKELPVFGRLSGDPIAVGDGILLVFRRAVFHSVRQATLYFEVVTQNGHFIRSHRTKLRLQEEFEGAAEPQSIILPQWSENPHQRRRFPAYAEVYHLHGPVLREPRFILTYVDWMTNEQRDVEMSFASIRLTPK